MQLPTRENKEAQAHRAGALSAVMSFVCSHPVQMIVVSLLLLAPCYWHRHLEAGDLASHTYNAWLASLVRDGRLPGLSLQRQWSNVLFDYALSSLIPLVGFGIAEKVAVSAAVLVFFWGAFALVAAAAERAPWTVVPCIAMVTYGWVFNMGFVNFYIATGLSFFFLALIWGGKGWELTLVLPLLALVWLGHTLAFALALSIGAYIYIARRVSLLWNAVETGVVLIAYFATRHYVIHHYLLPERLWNESWLVGAEQLHLYNGNYFWLALAVVLFSFMFAAASFVKDFPTTPLKAAVPLSVYLVIAIAVYFAPDGVWLPSQGAPLTMAADRLSLLTAVFGCCTIAACRVGRAQCAVYAFLALAFFALLYHDTKIVGLMESNTERLVSGLPKNSRVVGTIKWPGSHIGVRHIVDRACIDRCYSYANYEPSSHHFRVRVLRDNPFVTSDGRISEALQAGRYRIPFWKLPMYQIFHCGANMTDLCIRALQAGEINGEGASRPIAPSALSVPDDLSGGDL